MPRVTLSAAKVTRQTRQLIAAQERDAMGGTVTPGSISDGAGIAVTPTGGNGVEIGLSSDLVVPTPAVLGWLE